MFFFFDEKLKQEKLQILVSKTFENFYASLAQPMKLNEMRSIKEPNYSKIREIVRDPKFYGDPIMKQLAINSEALGISFNTYHLIMESFWDLYFKKPASPDLNSKKLATFINNFNLTVYKYSVDPEAEAVKDEDNEELPVKAVVRVRIPFKRPDIPAEGEDQLDEAASANIEAKSAKSKKSNKKEEDELEEIDFEDKVLKVPTSSDSYRIYVVHQVAQRLYREQIAREFKEYLNELAILDEDEMLNTVEKEAELYEKQFFQITNPELPVFDFELN